MSTIEPEGGMSLALEAVRTTITACPTWQAWVGVDDQPEGDRMALARQRTYRYTLPRPDSKDGYSADELKAMRPCCVLTYLPPAWLVRAGPGYGVTRTANEQFVESGTLYVHLIADVGDESDADPDDEVEMTKFVNRLGSLIDDMQRTADVPGSAFLRGIYCVVEPSRAEMVQKDMQGDFINAMLRVDWGLRR